MWEMSDGERVCREMIAWKWVSVWEMHKCVR